MEIIKKVLDSLAKNLYSNEIFLSEADFQFSFAQELDRILKENYKLEKPIIILEYPIMTNELYANNKNIQKEFCERKLRIDNN